MSLVSEKPTFDPGRGALNFWLGMSDAAAECQKEGGFMKVRSKELKIFNILRDYELKFGPELRCKSENSEINFGANFSHRSQNLSFFAQIWV